MCPQKKIVSNVHSSSFTNNNKTLELSIPPKRNSYQNIPLLNCRTLKAKRGSLEQPEAILIVTEPRDRYMMLSITIGSLYSESDIRAPTSHHTRNQFQVTEICKLAKTVEHLK